ncbi:ATP-binding protein [Streptomyces tendae]|uniref:ATP-binding protein n=1 Tax=Streptomyces tendae TaxID=1932 RepID=UPI0033F3EB6D
MSSTATHAYSDATSPRDGHELCITRDPASVPGGITERDALWPGRLRRVVRAALHRWKWPDLVTAEELLTTELVTNALRHGRGEEICYRLSLTATDLVTEVRDGSAHLAVLRHAAPHEEAGRGLFLVHAMADAWGVSSDGATTWCALSLHQGDDIPLSNNSLPVPVSRRYPTISLPGDRSAAARARTIARTGLTVMGWQGSVHAASDVIGRLVQNGVEHGVGDRFDQRITVDLCLDEAEYLVIDVRDPNPSFPDFDRAQAGGVGRGLWEVRRLGAVVTCFLSPERKGFYDLRHTGNTLAADTGAKLKDLMVRAGQSSERAQLIYQHSTAKHQRRLAQGIDTEVRERLREAGADRSEAM